MIFSVILFFRTGLKYNGCVSFPADKLLQFHQLAFPLFQVQSVFINFKAILCTSRHAQLHCVVLLSMTCWMSIIQLLNFVLFSFSPVVCYSSKGWVSCRSVDFLWFHLPDVVIVTNGTSSHRELYIQGSDLPLVISLYLAKFHM